MHGTSVTIRTARPGDRPALEQLASLDGQHLPPGRLVVAERDGELIAARPIRGEAVVADPFHRTREVGELLAAWARRLREEEEARVYTRTPHV